MNLGYSLKTERSPGDIYTLAHLGFGYTARQYGWSREDILLVATFYELIEDQLIDVLHLNRRIEWSSEPKANALVDIVAAYLGARLAEQ